MRTIIFFLVLNLMTMVTFAQEKVTAVADAEKLFTSPDPKLNANKQIVYHILRDLLEAHNWDKAGQYISDEYIQHNPNAASGRAGVVKYFTEILKVKATPIPKKLEKTKVVSVVAEGDLVVVAFVREMKDEKNNPYTTTWFDMWRIKDGKANQHWDPALKTSSH